MNKAEVVERLSNHFGVPTGEVEERIKAVLNFGRDISRKVEDLDAINFQVDECREEGDGSDPVPIMIMANSVRIKVSATIYKGFDSATRTMVSKKTLSMVPIRRTFRPLSEPKRNVRSKF